MKIKSVFLLIIILVGGVFLSSCRQLPVGYDTYFKNYTSVSAYSKVEKTLDLSEYEGFKNNSNNIYVSGYDEEADVYLITENIKIGEEIKTSLIGFCSATEVLIEPRYVHVLDIRGDYAIAVRYVAEGGIDKAHLKIGLIKFRGENKGAEYGFNYSYMAAIVQYTFLDGQYLAMLGNKYSQDKFQKDSKGNEYLATTFTFATVYDYASSGGKGLLYVGELANVANTTRFQLRDGHLVSSNNNVFRFHRFEDIDSNGFFKLKHTYTPFDKAATGFSESNIECEGYYIGNNWFVLTAIHSSATQYDSYEIIKNDDGKNKYLTVKSVRYNAGTGKAYDTDRVVLVANKYSDNLIRELSNAVNSQQEYYEDSRGVKGFYVPPTVPTSAAIKDGYSIIYYYFYYYDSGGARNWTTTFNIYDENANRINLKDLFMPLVFVDGIGLQNGDPNFNIPVRDATAYTYEGTTKLLQPLTETMGFDPIVTHGDMVIAYNFDTKTVTSSMGAYDREGNLAIPYRYYELTPFFGDYATASIVSGTGDNIIREFYRVSKTGAETLIEDVYALKNGVYVTVRQADKDTKKYGLRANDGTELLPAEYDTVSVIDSLLIDGKYIRTTVTAVKDGKGIIYKLG